ncbi:hypothetical protein HK107_00040 [Parvularcula sp. ZS-1/3]|uniref:TonB C-terminal domain-containing protein n=1 Tax=Parvularcula mediterranea TaxID=2732508 RepID=A0A7Y3W3R1_9PROT|nr:hypothetical protein [Parvularcula mediterranea]NNU14709.1 hypothetical protein [Parvularcula mediterranea]
MRLAIAAAFILAACATTPPEPPIIVDRSAEPFVRVSPQGFEVCFQDVELPYEALVEAEMKTSPDGFVTNAFIVRTTDPCLAPYVLAAVRQWRYPAKMVDGQLAARRGIRTILAFELSDDDVPETPARPAEEPAADE